MFQNRRWKKKIFLIGLSLDDWREHIAAEHLGGGLTNTEIRIEAEIILHAGQTIKTHTF